MNGQSSEEQVTVVAFTAAPTQHNATDGHNTGAFYYDTQLEELLRVLEDQYDFVQLICLARGLVPTKESSGKRTTVRLPKLCSGIICELAFSLHAGLLLLELRHESVILYSDASPVPALIPLFLVASRKIPRCLLLRNPPFSISSLRGKGLIVHYASRKLDTAMLSLATSVGHISVKAREFCEKEIGEHRNSFVFGSGASRSFFACARARERNTRTFAYWGELERNRDLATMVRGFSRACLPDASLHIFGDGDDAESVASAARESGDMVHVHGYLPQERLAEALADICFAVVPIPPHNFFQYSDPLKLAEALALGMPVLASDIEPTRDVIAHNRGVVCAHDEEGYSSAFTALAELSDEDVAAMSGACLSGAHAVSRDAVFSELLGVLGKGT